ncbi:hypothetical protein Nepgr_028376 [Nepenthes gracilis]|uniref:Uncharacterized protein n=1 Tax=Nepenthes gracilis TaxID=150966 RepID=A0AAD3Y2C8_NEPGR|nr:hypothetical protein Nepgr_028376 [Nepenthes gracilis]
MVRRVLIDARYHMLGRLASVCQAAAEWTADGGGMIRGDCGLLRPRPPEGELSPLSPETLGISWRTKLTTAVATPEIFSINEAAIPLSKRPSGIRLGCRHPLSWEPSLPQDASPPSRRPVVHAKSHSPPRGSDCVICALAPVPHATRLVREGLSRVALLAPLSKAKPENSAPHFASIKHGNIPLLRIALLSQAQLT